MIKSVWYIYEKMGQYTQDFPNKKQERVKGEV